MDHDHDSLEQAEMEHDHNTSDQADMEYENITQDNEPSTHIRLVRTKNAPYYLSDYVYNTSNVSANKPSLGNTKIIYPISHYDSLSHFLHHIVSLHPILHT